MAGRSVRQRPHDGTSDPFDATLDPGSSFQRTMTTMEIVADKLIEEGSVTLGIELLEAECSEQSLPEEKAKLHLNLSLKLSQYTRNFTQARDHALKAVRMWIWGCGMLG